VTIDLTGISLSQFVVVLVCVGGIDLVSGVLSALVNKTFDWTKLPAFVEQHALKFWLPIGGTAFIAWSLPDIGSSPTAHQVVFTAAIGLLVLYVLDTLQSLKDNYNAPTPTGIKVTSTPVAK
jgi:hypothetical protein